MFLMKSAQETLSRARGQILTMRDEIGETMNVDLSQEDLMAKTGENLLTAGLQVIAMGALQLGTHGASKAIHHRENLD